MKKSPNPVDKHVGSRVRMRRLMLDMSQEKLGSALGLTFQQVQKYEKGTNRIGASRLQHISEILQVPVAFFFEGAPTLHQQRGGLPDVPLSRPCVRLPRQLRWARPYQGIHADQGAHATAPDCCAGQANRRHG